MNTSNTRAHQTGTLFVYWKGRFGVWFLMPFAKQVVYLDFLLQV